MRSLAAPGRKTALVSALLLAGFAATPAFAAAPPQPDVTDVVAYMTAGLATIALLGNARLLIGVAVSMFRWVRGAMR